MQPKRLRIVIYAALTVLAAGASWSFGQELYWRSHPEEAFTFNRTWTLLGVPCVTLPAARGTAGLPLGIQLVAGYDEGPARTARR